MGKDHVEWAKSQPSSLSGIDLTRRAIEHTKKGLALYGLHSGVVEGDAENLPFCDKSFDLVYSWGVLHHSPNTANAINEVCRVLRPNGIARIMIYHKYSLTGYLLWMRYGLLAGRPLRSLSDIYANYLESPCTKAYSIDEARMLFGEFSQANFRIQLSFGDLLQGLAGERHGGVLLRIARSLWPRWLLKRGFKNHGISLLIEARR
jgi:ubiquinone/menaquinone biosynthesis C-methylase UbiE